jgi:hypothetical protein
MTKRSVAVFGPAYLDRVLHVDRPLALPLPEANPIDQSVAGALTFAPDRGLRLVDPGGFALEIELPSGWPGPIGTIELDRSIHVGAPGLRRVQGVSWHDDLGGMGAGFAAALNGSLVSAVGAPTDATSQAILRRIAAHAIEHDPIRVPDRTADWTLLISSGPFGDKLAVGFRGCHAALVPESFGAVASRPTDLRVVAALPNRLASALLRAPGAGVRLFAPAARNMLDREFPVGAFASAIDVICCNRSEWEMLEEREEVAWQLSILAITDGPRGSTVRFTTPAGEPGRLSIPAFPRSRPPRDTNRAGEAYAATLITALLDRGWSASTGVVDQEWACEAAQRASAAAALELDRLEFGFPTVAEIDESLSRASRLPT